MKSQKPRTWPLTRAAFNNDLPRAKEILTAGATLAKGPAERKFQSDMEMALRAACRNGLTEVVALILDHGGNPDCGALWEAVDGEKAEVVRLLLAKGAKAQDRYDSSLFRACGMKATPVIELLLRHYPKEGLEKVLDHPWGEAWAKKELNRRAGREVRRIRQVTEELEP